MHLGIGKIHERGVLWGVFQAFPIGTIHRILLLPLHLLWQPLSPQLVSFKNRTNIRNFYFFTRVHEAKPHSATEISVLARSTSNTPHPKA